MDAEPSDQDEAVRRTVHLILDLVSVSEGMQHTDELPPGWAEQFVAELLELDAITVDFDDELDPSILILAVRYIVETLLLTVLDRSDDDRLALISSIRENANQSFGVG